jgi:hypothetical protein
VRTRLWLLVGIVALPAAVLSGWLIFHSYQNERRAMERHLIETASAVSLLIDAELRERVAVLQGLGASTPLVEGNLAAFRTRIQRMVTRADEWIVLTDSAGRELLNTSTAPRAEPRQLDISPEFQAAIATGRPYLSHLIASPAEPRFSVFLAVGVKIGPTESGILCLAMTPAWLSASLLRNRFVE